MPSDIIQTEVPWLCANGVEPGDVEVSDAEDDVRGSDWLEFFLEFRLECFTEGSELWRAAGAGLKATYH